MTWEVLWEQEGLELCRAAPRRWGELSPSWAMLIGKEHFGPSLCPSVSPRASQPYWKAGGITSIGRASGEPRECRWAEPNWAQGGIQHRNLQNSWFKQTNKQTNRRYFLLLCNKNHPDLCIPSPAPAPSWLCLHLRTFPVFP